jgi:ribosomal-protein-alanine N-acetyltransferase
MDEADLPWVLEVEQRVQRTPWTLAGFERALHQGLNFILCDGHNQRLGYVCLLPVVDELHLLNLSVDQVYQGQGVAKSALLALWQRFEDSPFAIVLLEVRKSNRIARGLYSSLGFVQDGVRKNYYAVEDGTREDALLLSKPLR